MSQPNDHRSTGMAPGSELLAAAPRKPRLLWASAFCLLDTSSGASMAVREMLIQLAARGWEVCVLGAMVFDAEKGLSRLRPHLDALRRNTHKITHVKDGPLTHMLLCTQSIARTAMTAAEEGLWYVSYIQQLEGFRPDLVYFYGGQTLDMLVPDEAHARGIPVAAYLANGNYQTTRWCRDVDLIITDSQATAGHYAAQLGFRPLPVGAFIDPAAVLATQQSRRHVLMVNPSLAKGAAIAVQLALMLEKRRPDIVFEIVESRGDWHQLVRQISTILGEPRDALSNVIVTPNTTDMRPVYGRARLLLAPSLSWESFGRVAIEAMMNGIPALVSDRGGIPEAIGDGGIKIEFPAACYRAPYNQLLKMEVLEPVAACIERFWDDESYYSSYAERAFQQGQSHRMDVSTQRLVDAFAPLIARRAGDRDPQVPHVRPHKQLAPDPARASDHG